MQSNSIQRGLLAAKQMIKTSVEADKALARVQDLSGCLEGSTEEAELISLVFALEVWEAKEYWRRSAQRPHSNKGSR